MKKGVRTKEKNLKVGAEIIHLKGYNHAGIQEILLDSGVPKGSFYNYFKNKEGRLVKKINWLVFLFENILQLKRARDVYFGVSGGSAGYALKARQCNSAPLPQKPW